MWDVYLHFLLLLLNLGLWALRFRALDAALRLLGATIALTLLLEGCAAYLMLQLTRNLFLYHLLIPLQYVLYALVLRMALEHPRHKRAVLLSLPVYLLLVLFLTLSLQPLSAYNSYARMLKDLLLACWVLLYYRETFTGLKVVRLGREPMFWIGTGLFFCSVGSFFADGFMNYLLGLSFDTAHILYYISIFSGFLLYITFLIAFLLSTEQPTGHLHKEGNLKPHY